MGYRDMPHARIGEQLWLWRETPWEGVAPRDLTAARYALSLRPEPPRHEVHTDPMQCEMWPVDGPHRKKSPRRVVSAGAPLLLPLKRKRG